MDKINIAFGITEDWLKYTCVTMCSILSHASSGEYNFYILSTMSEEKFKENFAPFKEKLSSIYPFSINYIKMDLSDFDGIVHDKRVGVSAYFRLKLPSVTKLEKVIYLDSDLVVLDDIKQLWAHDISDYYLATVEDKYSALMTCQAGLSDDDTYFNSGVMVMNLKKFREDNLEEKIFNKLHEADNRYSDQDVLNDICRDKVLFLPLKYNLMLSRDDANSFPKRKDEYNEALKHPVIMHYSIKPWFLPVEYSEYWRKYKEIMHNV